MIDYCTAFSEKQGAKSDQSQRYLGGKPFRGSLCKLCLKRHRCKIDLGLTNTLVIPVGGGGETIEAPFLHEKDLDTAKGGTRGFDAERRTPSSWPHGRRPRRRWTTRETRP